MNEFYDGTKLLSLSDKNGQKPEIFICTSNRNAGKTTYFSRYLVRRFINNNEKFMLLYRFNYELNDCCDKFFKEIQTLFFKDYHMTSKPKAKGMYHDLFLNDVHCGYAVALNNADTIKKNSHMFADTVRMLMDEFQSETNHYCSNEITKFQSIHTSVARGGGEQIRYVPVYMVSNPVSIINPYYTAMGISSRLRKDTKFLKGDGYVLEQGFNESASDKQKSSAFNRAFGNSDYNKYSADGTYLNDVDTFIENPIGKGKYVATLRYKGVDYSIREYTNNGYIYIGKTPDMTYNYKICITTEDMNINYLMLQRNNNFIKIMRDLFNRGCIRFKDLQCKDAFFSLISY